MKHIFQRNIVHDSMVVFLESYQNGIQEEVYIFNDFRPKTATITVVSPQQISISFVLFSRYFHPNIHLNFHNTTFVNSQLFLQNWNVKFIDVVFENTTFYDTNPLPGEHGELQALFSKVQFLGTKRKTGVFLRQTFASLIDFSESIAVNTTIFIAVSRLSFSSANTLFHGSVLILNSTVLCLCSFEDIQLTNGVEGTGNNPPLSITAQVISCTFSHSEITNNTGGIEITKPHAGLLYSHVQVTIERCIFLRNTKNGSGGGVMVVYFVPEAERSGKSFVHILDSIFVDNVARQELFERSYGGALFVGSKLSMIGSSLRPLEMVVRNSSFVDNTAGNGGGAIFLSPDYTQAIILASSFELGQKIDHLSMGAFLLVFTSISIQNTSFTSKVKNHTGSIIELQMQQPTEEIGKLHTKIQCLPWMKLEVSTGFSTSSKTGEEILQKLFVSCVACPPSFFIHSDGKGLLTYRMPENQSGVVLYNSNGELLEQKCENCPHGADCPGNDLISKPNFCGLQTPQGIEFFQCPMEYCCQERPCQGYDQCSGNREGVLCGACREGYTLSMMSNSCVKKSECNDHWLWFVAVVGMCAYMLWYTFKNDLFALSSKCLSLFDKSTNSAEHKGYEEKEYFAILTFYVQASAVMRLNSFQQPSRPIDVVAQQIESYFGLALSMEISYVSSNVCAFLDMTSTTKIMFKLFFLFGIYGMWCVAYALVSLIIIVFKSKGGTVWDFFHKIKIRLIYGLTEIIKYTYLGFTYVMFSSLSCVTLEMSEGETGPDQQTLVWFYDGSVDCYSKWQISMGIFGLTYIIPYPIFLYVGLHLLTTKMITGKSLILGTFFPLPVLVYWAFLVLIQKPVTGGKHDHSSDWDNTCREAIHNGFKGGFRVSDEGTQYWECVLMARRFILCATTLLPNPVIQLCVCLALCLTFLLHHAHVKPFTYSLSNKAETLSLTFLVGIASINFGKSIFVFLGVSPQVSQVDIMLNLGLLENMAVFFVLCHIIAGEVILKIKQVRISKRMKSGHIVEPRVDLDTDKIPGSTDKGTCTTNQSLEN